MIFIKSIIIVIFLFLSLAKVSYSEENNGNQYSADWFSMNIPQWSKYKEELYNKPNKHCLEIGSWEGKSAIYIAENYCNGENSRLDCIDAWEDPKGASELVEYYPGGTNEAYKKFLHNTDKFIKNNKIIPHKGYSQNILIELLYKVKTGALHKYDFIYIDGSHVAKDVLLDMTLAWELLNVGGIMLMDDYLWFKGGVSDEYLRPKPAIDGFLAAYDSMYEILHKDYQVHIRKLSDAPIAGKSIIQPIVIKPKRISYYKRVRNKFKNIISILF